MLDEDNQEETEIGDEEMADHDTLATAGVDVEEVPLQARSSCGSSGRGRRKVAKETRKFVCEECHKEFATRRNLKDHTLIHKGEKPFLCQAVGCGRFFRTSTELSRHRKLHSNEKPHPCTAKGCKLSFRRRHHLTLHMKIHGPETVHSCLHTDCGQEFEQLALLKTHTAEFHPKAIGRRAQQNSRSHPAGNGGDEEDEEEDDEEEDEFLEGDGSDDGEGGEGSDQNGVEVGHEEDIRTI